LPKLDSEIDETHRASVEVGLSAMETRKAGVTINKALPGVLAGIQTDVDNAGKTLTTTNKAIADIDGNQNTLTADAQPVLHNLADALAATRESVTGLKPVETALTKTIGSANTLISDPHIAGTVAHLDAAAGNVQDMSADAKAKVHSLLHPKAWTTAVNVTERIAVDVGKIFF
jgi:ABC-type transporter Mla subunit MlaD